MNVFSKYCPNVFVAKCSDKHSKGDEITLQTKYGKEVPCEVHNYLGSTKNGEYLYSITRLDGVNSQEMAQRKADKLNGYAVNAEKRSTEYYEASMEGRDFLALGEPIKVGHHSERRHRKLIERNWQRMGKSVAEDDKAKEYKRRAEYWKERTSKIDLSTPDSLEYFEFKLQEAKEHHALLKRKPELREHSMSLQYANKTVKDLESKVHTAIKLWGSDEDLAQLEKEAQEKAGRKLSKKKNIDEIIKSNGAFFAFNNEQFMDGYNKSKEQGFVDEGEKVVHVGAGLYVPKVNFNNLKSQL